MDQIVKVFSVPADGTGLPNFKGSGDFGTSPFYGQLPGQASSSLPMRDGSAVSVRVFDNHVRRDGYPFAPSELKAGPVDPVSDILFRIGRFPPRVRVKELWCVAPEFLEQAQDDATLVAIHDQERAGLDIITDGEMRRVGAGGGGKCPP